MNPEPTIDIGVPYEERFVTVSGLQLHIVLAGPEDGEPLVFNHGFPEFWYAWKAQIPHFVALGYRVIATDQRGYNTSDKPTGIEPYHIEQLAADLVALFDVLGYQQVNLVAHDWGGFVAWYVAEKYAERVKKLVILNVPNVRVFAQAIVQRNWQQLRRVWYAYAFLIPALPEALLRSGDFNGMVRALKLTTNKGTFDPPQVQAAYKAAWGQPEALASMINWYRGLFRLWVRDFGKQPLPTITPPTLLIWGELDNTMYIGLAQPSVDMCADGHLVSFPDVTHWAQHDKPDAVNKLIEDFISQ